MLQTKRVHDTPDPADGVRVLVDRLWPRGLTIEAAALDEWLKDLAPSPALRTWFNHDAGRWDEFVRRYRRELAAPAAAPHLDRLANLARKGTVALLYAAREERHNSASVLRDVLEERLKPPPRSKTKAGR
jgi:uncharacterized protein YeaO (DUF488 family)